MSHRQLPPAIEIAVWSEEKSIEMDSVGRTQAFQLDFIPLRRQRLKPWGCQETKPTKGAKEAATGQSQRELAAQPG